MRPRLYATLRSGIVRPLFRLLYRVQIDGGGRVPAAGPAVLVANHESLLDPFALALVTRRPIRFFVKKELCQRWWLAPMLEALGGIEVVRWRGAPATIRRGEEALVNGELVAIFPEGRIHRDGRRFEHGAARLALDTGAPLVPVRIMGTSEALRRWKVGLPQVRLVVALPIRPGPGRPTARRERRLMEQARERIEALR